MVQISFFEHLAREGTAWDNITTKAKRIMRIFKLLNRSRNPVADFMMELNNLAKNILRILYFDDIWKLNIFFVYCALSLTKSYLV
tara:strand:- start:5 stop:259 length:255 start_codon:yes stop_codon:yes gene_type:complete